MKVAMLCNYALPKKYAAAGSTRYESELVYYLSRKKNIELYIITIGKENGQFKKDNLTIHTIKKRKIFYLPYFTPLLLWRTKCKIKEINPDVVHALSAGYLYSTATALLRDKYPTVLTAYGFIIKDRKYEEDYKYIYPYIFALFGIINERYVLSKIPNVIVQTPSIKNIINKWTNSKIHIVPSGIEYEEIKKMQSQALPNESLDIFLANNLQKIKGVDILIKAIPTVIKAIPNLSVCIGGSGPQGNGLKSLVKRLNLDKHVKFLGFISEEEKYQYYKACKLVVAPSRWDCQPFAPLDAAASGKPVVASRIGGIQDTVEDGKTGFLFEPENIEDLADKIVMLLKDGSLREEMGKTAKEKAKNYDWSKIAERTVEIYKEVIADFYGQKTKNTQKREKIL